MVCTAIIGFIHNLWCGLLFYPCQGNAKARVWDKADIVPTPLFYTNSFLLGIGEHELFIDMKTFRAIGMAMLAVLLCVGNTSCSKEDDLGNNGGATSGSKKLTKIIQTRDNGDSEEVTFSYDNNGRLISCYEEGNIHQFSWSDNYITRTKGNDVRTYSYVDGLVRQEKRDNRTLDYAYSSSKQILALNWFDKYSNEVDQKDTYSWKNGKITQILHEENDVMHTTQITYGSKTCKGYNPLMTLLMSNTQLFWVHPELIGVTYNQLPTTVISDNRVKNFSYVFDKDGYIVAIEVKVTKEYDGNHQESLYTYTYTFTWE